MSDTIEPKIKPLVDALNEIPLIWTFSSCEGHYDEYEQELQNRNKADVRFELQDNYSDSDVELFLNYLLVEFEKLQLSMSMLLCAYGSEK